MNSKRYKRKRYSRSLPKSCADRHFQYTIPARFAISNTVALSQMTLEGVKDVRNPLTVEECLALQALLKTSLEIVTVRLSCLAEIEEAITGKASPGVIIGWISPNNPFSSLVSDPFPGTRHEPDCPPADELLGQDDDADFDTPPDGYSFV